MSKNIIFIHELHEYVKSKYNKEVYRCAHPRCSHFIKKDFLVGKESICHKCKSPFILTLEQLRNKYTVCLACSKSPKALEFKNAQELVKNVFDVLDLPDEVKNLLKD